MSDKKEAVKEFIWNAGKTILKYGLVLLGASVIFSVTGIGDLSTGALAGLAFGTAVVDTAISTASAVYTKAKTKKTEKEAREARDELEQRKDREINRLNNEVIAGKDAEIARLQGQVAALEAERDGYKNKVEGNKTIAADTLVNVRQLRLIVTAGSADVAAATAVLDEIERDQRTIRS